MLRYLRIAFGALAMITVMVLAAGITLRLALHAGEVSIPNFSGLTVQEASNAALRAGLDLNINNKFYSTTVPAGRILSQAPAPGSQVRQGWQVRVAESLGPQDVSIPDVVGEPVRAATMDLRRNQLDLGAQAHLDAPGDPDMVLAQTPPPNAGVDQPRVNLLLSSEAQDASTAFVMPSFVGQAYTSANHEAIALGLRVATIGGMPATPPPSRHPCPTHTRSPGCAFAARLICGPRRSAGPRHPRRPHPFAIAGSWPPRLPRPNHPLLLHPTQLQQSVPTSTTTTTTTVTTVPRTPTSPQ